MADREVSCSPLAELKLTRDQFFDIARHQMPQGEMFSMGVLALRNAAGRNAVSELHGQVARKMWHFLWENKTEAEVPITHITNGVHVSNWMARRLVNLFKDYLGKDWLDHQDDPDLWARVDDIPDDELWAVRLHLKRKLAFYMRERVRDRWKAGGFPSGASCFLGHIDQPLRPDHWIRTSFCNV